MRRSLAPSQVVKRRLDDSPTHTGRRRVCVAPSIKPAATAPVTSNEENEDMHTEHEALINSILCRPFRVPLANYQSGSPYRSLGIRRSGVRQPLHDPDAPDALVVYSPAPLSLQEQMTATDQEVAVVVDPLLATRLRPHQREGVQWMYECVTGLRDESCRGCILADEMGLGKTLQCVTLSWTLLRQSPAGPPWGTNVVVVAPSVLVQNWADEVKKWLGDRLPVTALKPGPDVARKLNQFSASVATCRRPTVLVLSYEALRMNIESMKNVKLGLLVCDEAHRLKNAASQTYIAVAQLQTQATLLVTGTPVQNDLKEYFALLQLACQGLLGEAAQFRGYYEIPILRANDPDATEKEQQLGAERMAALWQLAGRFVLRRSQALLRKFLPPKIDLVVCVSLTPVQKQLYPQALQMAGSNSNSQKGGTTALTAIAWLKKLIAHPDLTKDSAQSGPLRVEESGKMRVVDAILAATAPDKMVLVSNSTLTLTVLQRLCELRRIGCLRLDGATSATARAKVVARFNDVTDATSRVLLLSSKAGGCGLNLIGANRLILVDPDWNPANDEQALARVWRDGQQRPCFVYRLLATGTMEEKMFQRQALKKAVGACVVDGAGAQRNFSRKEMKQLFMLSEVTTSDTHTAMRCKRCIGNVQTREPPKMEEVDDAAAMDLQNWHHAAMSKQVPDQALRLAWNAGVTFVFYRVSEQKVAKAVPSQVTSDE